MKMTFWTSLPARKRRLAWWILGLFLFYIITVLLILPPVIRAVAVKQLSAQLDRKVSIQKIALNPFAASVAVRGLLIMDKDGQPFVSWDEVYVDFELSSIFRKAWTFKVIRVTAPYFRAQMNKDYTFNFSDLLEKFPTNAPASAPKEPAKPLFVCVKRFIVRDAKVSLADYTLRTPFKRVVGPVDLTIENVNTEPAADGAGMVMGTTDDEENFRWHGAFCLSPLRSSGNMLIYGVTMNKFAPLYQDLVPFVIRSGRSGFCADYRFEWSPSNHVAIVTNAAFGLDHFRLAQRGATNDIFDLYHFAETGVSGDLSAHRGEIGHILVSGARVFLERGRNKTLNVVAMSQLKTGAPVAPGGILVFLNTITNAVATLINTTNQWTGVIHEVTVTNCAAHLEDLANARPATLDLDKIDAEVKNISNVPDTNVTAAVSLDWNKHGKINVGATAMILPPTVDVHLAMDNLDLSTLAPEIESQFNLLVPGADFGMDGELRLHTPANQLPVVKFKGDVWLDHFRVLDGLTGGDLLKWDSIRVSGIKANLNPPSVSIRNIAVKNLSTRVVIETNGVINLLAALKPPGTNAAAAAKSPEVAKTSAPAGNATNAFSLAGLPQVSIAGIHVTNAQISFTDRSLSPNVNIIIAGAGGAVTGLSTSDLQHGDIALHALVEGSSPADVMGRINPFSGTLTNQVSVFMTNMDLRPTSPYSGKFAGYGIRRGTLSLDLHYTVTGRKLSSENVITLNQFTFGDKVNSPVATKLPVRLAIAILKDRNGVIVLNVPIVGTLDDPKFRIGKVVERALVNILTKVATSPFSLLGAAFGGGGAELSHEDFDAGSAVLPDASRRKLDVLIKALYNRPGLQLDISGSVDPVTDREGLQRFAFEKELRTREWQSLHESERETTAPGQIILTPKQRAHLVKRLYDEALHDGRISPAIIAANTNLASIAARIKSPEFRVEKLAEYLEKPPKGGPKIPAAPVSKQPAPPANPMEALLIAIIPVSESDLESLAMDRSKAVRSYILASGKVDAGRLVVQKPKGQLLQDGSRVDLQLE